MFQENPTPTQPLETPKVGKLTQTPETKIRQNQMEAKFEIIDHLPSKDAELLIILRQDFGVQFEMDTTPPNDDKEYYDIPNIFLIVSQHPGFEYFKQFYSEKTAKGVRPTLFIPTEHAEEVLIRCRAYLETKNSQAEKEQSLFFKIANDLENRIEAARRATDSSAQVVQETKVINEPTEEEKNFAMQEFNNAFSTALEIKGFIVTSELSDEQQQEVNNGNLVEIRYPGSSLFDPAVLVLFEPNRAEKIRSLATTMINNFNVPQNIIEYSLAGSVLEKLQG